MNKLRFIKKGVAIVGVLTTLMLGNKVQAQVYDKVVAQDGSGNTYSISAAISRIVNSSSTPVRIYIKNGVYKEKIEINSSQKNICFIGESVDGVIITNDNYSGDNENNTTSSSYTIKVDGDGFYAENLTIKNTAGNVGQAVALMTDAKKQVFKNCKLIGFQDTYYAHSGMQYFNNCYIEGATDYIFGDGTVVFDTCQINSVKGGQYITAPADSKLTSTRGDASTMIHGLLFKECTLTANDDVADNSYYLGRPWQPNSSTVYLNCTLGSHIKPEGWSTWSDENHLSSYFAEYKSVDENNNLVETSNRVDWSYQISDDYATNYYNLEYFLTENSTAWDPQPVTNALSAPANLTMNNTILAWETVTEAIGYVIIRNDSTIGFSQTNQFTDEAINRSKTNTYTVKSVNTYGNLSKASDAYTIAATAISSIGLESNTFSIAYTGSKEISVSSPATITIYDMSGKLIKQYPNQERVNLKELSKGIYIVSAINKQKNIATKKIWIQ